MTNREVDGVSVVALDGRIVLGEESNALREKVKGLIAEGKKKIVLNMDNVTFIDSAGLGTLVASHHSVKRSEEHTSELQSHHDLVCRLLLEKKKKNKPKKNKQQKKITIQ